MSYQVVDTFSARVFGETLFFVTLWRPGRQRWMRAAFDNADAAKVYGARVAWRFARMYCGAASSPV